jgi:hypothetical protein
MMETEEGDSVEKVKKEVMEVRTALRGVVKLTTGADRVSEIQDGPEVGVEAAVADGMAKTGVGHLEGENLKTHLLVYLYLFASSFSTVVYNCRYIM